MTHLHLFLQVQPNSPPVMYNTLLELYLQGCAHQTDGMVSHVPPKPSISLYLSLESCCSSCQTKTEQERRMLDLLQNAESGYDLDQALVMCHMHGFKAGILFLYEKAKL